MPWKCLNRPNFSIASAKPSRHLSRKTENSYLDYIQDFILFHQKRHPRQMGTPEVRASSSHGLP
ncbi:MULTISPECIES: phage integrase N-terminal SAM-like domain-containing protein [Limnospira]|uniref:Phage integrase N-terminal SAM-like domain-containing protein n=1 Tax=Limnospira fusiformis PMC 851.14 TaxID=2219512 RepID=A0ABU9EMA5_LIMFS|nr:MULTISPECIES: phage integrase N-terminal SAM-like domain-containing protein [Limnospira]MDC0837038.1 phage integrase N-terminal SAM-like domain-containing protein [Limnoraphis robusta]MDY7051022.1 phage integrase N-terminal SAM-like domain-containing protein [Limnospira fusiformis LS22]MDT9188254.1 phage integrase N-terminal SAM-like domain-containing protein [Limnospira sp. PMC 894.15]MDT9199939.1 phage integrase N-terminal SAM-like domain-containing protein [Limnospira sp. PMC 1042.18]MDT